MIRFGLLLFGFCAFITGGTLLDADEPGPAQFMVFGVWAALTAICLVLIAFGKEGEE